MLQRSGRAIGLIEPCLPSPAKTPPSGPDWLHEIKRDGFRLMARRDACKLGCEGIVLKRLGSPRLQRNL
jgi:ATP-dependent DNA ligase